jgi:branched-chain amino acid transport system substrate-binding protein
VHIRKRWTALAATVLAGIAVAGIFSTTSGATTQLARSASILGTPKVAKGSPMVFGLINLDLGPVTFPEVKEAEFAAADYVNNYQDGINGHPIKIDECSGDGTPATSARCANEILSEHPVAILGGADTGGAGSVPIWAKHGLALLGGAPFTPVESNATNSVIFISIAVADNAAVAGYEKSQGIKTVSIIPTDDTQGLYTGSIIQNSMEHAGITAKMFPVAPDAADFTTVAALATADHPQLVYDETPNACAGVLKALTSVGYTGKIAGIDTCTAPPVIASAGGSANGLVFAQPFISITTPNPQAVLTAALLKKYAPATIAIDTPALAGVNAVMNVSQTFRTLKAPYTLKKVLGAFEKGSNHPNWMAHPYTCNRSVIPAQASVCDQYEIIKKVEGTKVVTISGYLTGVQYYKPPKG